MAQTHQPARSGSKTAAEELARRSGTGTGSAKDAISTSQRLSDQPRVAGALRRGELSAAQAAAISDAAAVDPSAEQKLIELAGQASLAELRAECLRLKAAADRDPDATHRRIHDQRRLRRWTDDEGAWNLSAHGIADAGAGFTRRPPPPQQAAAQGANPARRGLCRPTTAGTT